MTSAPSTSQHQVQAPQFEWAWQHPDKSKIVREVVARLKTSQRKGLQGKVHILVGMLGSSPWCYYPLTLQVLSEEHVKLIKAHIPVIVAPMEQLPMPAKQQQHEEEEEEQQQQEQQIDATAAAAAGDEPYEVAEETVVHDLQQDSQFDDGEDSDPGQSVSSDDESQQQQQRRRRRRLPLGQEVTAAVLQDIVYEVSSGSSDDGDVVLLDNSSNDELPNVSRLVQGYTQLQQQLSFQAGSGAVADLTAAADVEQMTGSSKGRQKKKAAAGDKAASGPRCGVCQRAMERFVLTCPHCCTDYLTECLATALIQQQQTTSGSRSRAKKGLTGTRANPVAAAAAADADAQCTGSTSSIDMTALHHLAGHLNEQYPHLLLPKDPQQLAAVLLGHGLNVSAVRGGPQQDAGGWHSQQRQQQLLQGTEVAEQQRAGRRVLAAEQQQQQLQQQQHGSRQGTSFSEWLQQQQDKLPHGVADDDACGSPPAAAPTAAVVQQAATQIASEAASEVLNLCDADDSPSPPPLLARLQLGSPLGKRVRHRPQPSAAVRTSRHNSDDESVRVHDLVSSDSGGSPAGSSSSSNSGSGSDVDREGCAAVRRLRLNGTTPVVMAKQKSCGSG